MSRRATHRSDHRSFRGALLHHLFSAAVITSAVVWLSAWSLMGALDSQTLLAVNRFVSLSAAEPPEPSENHAPPEPPLVLTISKRLYQEKFNNTSPLDRTELATLLTNIKTANPMLLVLDLDLSPVMPGATNSQAEVVDGLLDDMSSASTAVVLLVPSFEGTPELSAAQSKWMSDRCPGPENASKRLYFGLSGLPNEAGVILRHPRHYPSIGNVARWAADFDYAAGGAALASSCHSVPQPGAVCAFFRENDRLPDLKHYFSEVARRCGSEPIDFRWMNDTRYEENHVVELDSLAVPDSTNRVVFLGGSYDGHDVHPTGVGPKDGVVVHAAVFASDTRSVPHARAALLEVALGVLLGSIFAALWTLRLRARERYHAELYRERALPSLLQWFASTAFLISMIVVGGISAVVMLLVSARCLGTGLWLNPVPLVVGMALDGYVVSRRWTATAPAEHGTLSHGQWKLWVAGNAGFILGLSLIVITVIKVSFEALSAHH